MKIVNKRNIYMLSLFVICLLMFVIVPTYAKFGSNYVTDNDMVGLVLNFDVNISNVEEYQQVVVPAHSVYKFNVEITNDSEALAYYGVWYRMVEPSEKSSDISIGRLDGTDVTTSGEIASNGVVMVTVAIVNSKGSQITVDIGVASSTSSTSDIEYLNGKRLIKGDVEDVIVNSDIEIASITIDSKFSDSLPTDGIYTMTSSCANGSSLSWDTYSKSLTYASGSYVGDECSLTFTSSTDYKYLYEMPVGSYVKYVGSGGTLTNEDGTTTVEVACQNDSSLTSSATSTYETEAPLSCQGQNAREDMDSSNYTYGNCHSIIKYYVTGWRIAYIDSTTNKAVIVSAGSPECNARTAEEGNAHYIKTANSKALKYCNPAYVDGDENGNKCTCIGVDSDSDGIYDQCSTASVDAWAINDNDFNMMTTQMTGILGGGYLYTSITGATKCGGVRSNRLCGYNNDLIDNGGYYWFAAQYGSTSTDGVFWSPTGRFIASSTSTNAYGLRPIINLSSSVFVTGGSGTMKDPYIIANTN